MSEIAPTHDSLSLSQLAAFAFQSVNGLQAGQVFALDSSKNVLQFDGVGIDNPSPPTRCLVIQGPNGVAIRTIQGEMAVNDRVQQDAWLNVNDELSCGNVRLRLIRRDESALVLPDNLEHETRCNATHDPHFLEPANPPPSTFFAPFTFDDRPEISMADQTMWLLSHGLVSISPCEESNLVTSRAEPLCGVEIIDFGAAGQNLDLFHQVVGWQSQEPSIGPSFCDLQPQTGVQGVIIH